MFVRDHKPIASGRFSGAPGATGAPACLANLDSPTASFTDSRRADKNFLEI